MDASQILTLIGLLVIVGAGQTATTRYLLGRIRESDRDRAASIAELHKRVDETKDTYLRRDDFMAHAGRIESGLDRLNARFDSWADGKDKV